MIDRDRFTAIKAKIYAVFDGREAAPSVLSRLCLDLIGEQRGTWPMLRDAYDSLGKTIERDIRCEGFSVRVQHNPGRIASTLAPVENGGTNGRPCFLCSGNLPTEQRGILYRDRYLILPNPMPVLPFHCTVAYVHHEPQAISGEIAAFLRLMVDLGPDWTVLYNGPRCGASAPDHLHFQIIPSGRMPIEKEAKEKERWESLKQMEGAVVYCVANLGRQAVVLEGDNPAALERAFNALLRGLRDGFPGPLEPMINIAGFSEGDCLSLVVFPRRKHRPDAFFESDDRRIVVSPAVVEMGGILVAPVEKDFTRLDGPLVEAIFAEVSLKREHLRKVLKAMEP